MTMEALKPHQTSLLVSTAPLQALRLLTLTSYGSHLDFISRFSKCFANIPRADSFAKRNLQFVERGSLLTTGKLARSLVIIVH